MATHTVKKKIVEIDGVEYLEVETTHITLIKKEELLELKDKKEKDNIADEEGMKELDDNLKLFKK